MVAVDHFCNLFLPVEHLRKTCVSCCHLWQPISSCGALNNTQENELMLPIIYYLMLMLLMYISSTSDWLSTSTPPTDILLQQAIISQAPFVILPSTHTWDFNCHDVMSWSHWPIPCISSLWQSPMAGHMIIPKERPLWCSALTKARILEQRMIFILPPITTFLYYSQSLIFNERPDWPVSCMEKQ